MRDQPSKHQELPGQMQNAIDLLTREGARAYDVERGLASLEKAVEKSAVGSASPSAGSAFGWKVTTILGGAALIGIVAYGTASTYGTAPDAATEEAVTSTGPAAAFAPPPSVATSAALPAPSVASDAVTVASLPVEQLPSSPARASSVGSSAAKPLPPRADRRKAGPSAAEDLTEAELAHAARLRALATVDPAAALREAAEGDRLFPRGVLGEEREAIAIRALAKLGNAAVVRERAARYLAAHPTGPFAEEVRQLAGAEQNVSPKERL
jgi:hypothetical protein